MKSKLLILAVFGVVLGVVLGGCSSHAKVKPISDSQWITPNSKICKANGGVMSKGINKAIAKETCRANWADAQKICSLSGGRLLTIYELEKVVSDCEDSGNYKSCILRKGFGLKGNLFILSGGYWSSTSYGWGTEAYRIYPYYHKKGHADIRIGSLFHCIRDGQ